MKLIIDEKINKYYVQMLCMIFFPGEKFPDDELISERTPILELNTTKLENGVSAFAKLQIGEKQSTAERFCEYRDDIPGLRTEKIAIGASILAVCGEMLGYRPSWGMLTGVRPSKVAMSMLLRGFSKTRVKKLLSTDYFVIPKKAALATDVALNEEKIIGIPDKKDCSVYISIPFCPTRCSYCSFVSYTSNRLLSLIPEYLIRLAEDIEYTFDTIRSLGLCVKTVYIGGGTPTTLDEKQLEFLLNKISECTDVSALEEFTLEAGRPDTINERKVAIAKKYGITRMSVNPQSLSDEILRGIGRNHTAADFFRAFDMVRNAGIKNINTDLIVGLPGDNFSTFSSTFDQILALRPENITVHTFCIKKASDIIKAGKGVYSLRGGDAGKCVDYSQIQSQDAGYKPYYMYRQKNAVGNFENVGFALENTEGLYNIFMMEEVHSIFSVGAGAVTKLVKYVPEVAGSSSILRIFNPKYPYEYLRDDRVLDIRQKTEQFYKENNLI